MMKKHGLSRRARFAPACSVMALGAFAGFPALADLDEGPDNQITITAEHLNKARDSIDTRIGATVYKLTDQSIANQPGGEDIPLNQTLLQAPGVSQDSFGQLHLRNDHANIQYRIDDVILPEGISLFGQSLPARIAASIDLITGSLPAQYGLVTTGIVDIHTKSGAFEQGGSAGFYGGSNGWIEPSLEFSGSSGHFNYYLSGDFTQNDLGVENPTSASRPIHDRTQQGHAFALFEDFIDSSSKLSALFGLYTGSFQIPDSPGQAASFPYGNRTVFDSAKLNEHQLEVNDYAVLSYLRAEDKVDFQVSAFARYSKLAYTPDTIGDLMFYGLAQTAFRTDIAEGLQEDTTYRLGGGHTLRFGGQVQAERAMAVTDSLAFGCGTDPTCASPNTSPTPIVDGGGKNAYTYSAYLQDEWQLTPSVTLNYGLRYDILNGYTNDDQVSPRANIVWKPDEDTALHAGYSRYFTPPLLEDISGESVGKFAYTTGYPNGYTPLAPPQIGKIRPERSNYFDVGAEHTILPGLRIGLDAYAKIAQDLIDEGQFGAPIILAVFNYSHANVFGTELTTSYNQGNWSAYGNFAVGREKATNIISQQFNFSPDDLNFIAHNTIYTDHNQWFSASGGVSYKWGAARFSGDFLYGTGLRSANPLNPAIRNGSTVAPYLQVNLGASYRFDQTPAGPMEWTFNLVNLTDRDYLIRSGSGVGVFAPQYGPRRAYYSGIRFFF